MTHQTVPEHAAPTGAHRHVVDRRRGSLTAAACPRSTSRRDDRLVVAYVLIATGWLSLTTSAVVWLDERTGVPLGTWLVAQVAVLLVTGRSAVRGAARRRAWRAAAQAQRAEAQRAVETLRVAVRLHARATASSGRAA